MKILKKVYNYYEYNGLKATLKAIIRKLFPFYKKTYLKNIEKMKNFDLTEIPLKSEQIKKENKNIFIMATVPYYDVGGGQRSAQLAKIFNRLGFNIYYIYAFSSSEKNIPFMEIPVTYHKYIENVDLNDLEKRIKKDDLFIFEAPTKSFEPYLKLAKKKKNLVVYENIDNWESSLGNILFNEETLKLMLKEADMITATALELVKQTKKYVKKYSLIKEVVYLPNAVDDELFNSHKEYEKPHDLIIGTKTFLYYGSLWGEWFDWDIIKTLAQNDESIAINLIGDDTNIRDIKNDLPSNVHFLGLKKQNELPSYLQYVDYALLPFKPGNIGNYVSPLKIFEYIAMDKVVLATNLPDLKNYPNVHILKNSKEWLEYLKKDPKLENNQNFISQNNWYSRCSTILDYLYPSNTVDKEFYKNISIVILNYNNKNVIFRCVDTLLSFKERYQYQIIVVDNKSTDGSYEGLQKYKDKITLVRNSKNGCSSGRNLGVKNAIHDYILFLDSDEWITNKYWLDNYLKVYLTNSNIGAIGWAAGWFDDNNLAYKVAEAYEFKYMPPNIIARSDIGYLATCGFLMKKDLFNEIGGFDEAYDPTCYEDTDLSLNIRHHGYQIYYSINLGVGHLPHQTTKSGSKAHTKLIMEKGDYFRNKWLKINADLINNYKK